MARADWSTVVEHLGDDDRALITAYRDHVRALLPDAEERVSRTEVAFAGSRGFTSAHIKSHRLQLTIDLRRRAGHPQLRDAFATTRTVTTHRIDLTEPAQLGSLDELLREAWETVGR